MNINKYTEKAREAIAAAIELARQHNNPQVEPEREVQINPPCRDRACCDAEQVGCAEAPGDHVFEFQVLWHAAIPASRPPNR